MGLEISVTNFVKFVKFTNCICFSPHNTNCLHVCNRCAVVMGRRAAIPRIVGCSGAAVSSYVELVKSVCPRCLLAPTSVVS